MTELDLKKLDNVQLAQAFGSTDNQNTLSQIAKIVTDRNKNSEYELSEI